MPSPRHRWSFTCGLSLALLALLAPSASAQESVSYPFQLEGALVVETCDAAGDPVARAINSIDIFARGRATPTCSTTVGASDPTCAVRAAQEGTFAALVAIGGAWRYAAPLQRLLFTEPELPALPELIGPITYRLHQQDTGSAGPRVYFQGGTRYVQYTQPLFVVTAPSSASEPTHDADGQVLTLDLRNQNMASLRVSLSFQPTRTGSGGTLDVAYGANKNIASSTNASPIEITTTAAHGYVDGDRVEITGHTGNTSANGVWVVDRIDSTRFTLIGSVGVAAGGASGTSRSHLGATERIANVRFTAAGTDGATHSIIHHFNSSARVLDLGQDPSTVNGFLETRAMTLGDSQVIRAEIPITPSAGPLAVTSYGVTAFVTFEDNTRVTVALPAPTTFAPCSTVTLPTVEVVKPRTTLNGSILLRPPSGASTSPYVTDYAPLVRWISSPNGDWSDGYVRTSSSGATIYNNVNAADQATTPATAQNAYAFTWTGFPEGNYRLEARTHSGANTSYHAGHALLSFPGRPQFTYLTSNSPVSDAAGARFSFPSLGAVTTSSPASDFATSAEIVFAENVPVALTVAADMAFVQGDFELTGCVDNQAVSSGAAELLGEVAGLRGGFARGLFRAGDSDYLIAAIAGGWRESRYRLKLDEAGEYNGMILVDPAAPATYGLVAQQTIAGEDRTYATSRVTIAFDTGGQLVRKPRLEIGQEPGTATAGLEDFYDPASPTTRLGAYYSVSNELDDLPVIDPMTSIYALNSATPVTIRPSVEVLVSSSPEVWARDYRPTITVLVSSGDAAGCEDICIHYAADGSAVTYVDDGQGPIVTSLTPSETVAAGTTSTTLTGTLTDQVPITEVYVNGFACSLTPGCSLVEGAGGLGFIATFTLTVPLALGDNTFSVTGRGLCGKTTTLAGVTVITVPPDLCADMSFDMCMEDQPGSIFWVDLVRTSDNAVCRLRCETAAPGAPITCDPTPICPE